MAADAAAIKYARSATYGSAAYDLNRVRGYAVPQETPYYDIPYERPYEKPAEKAAPKTRTAERKAVRGVSVFSAAGFLLSAALVVLMLLSYVQLAEISGETTRLENEIIQLETDHAKLRVQYESAFNLTEVEEYATSAFGMSKLTSENTNILNVNRADKAVILKSDESTGSSTVEATSEFLTSLMEYFK